MHHRHDEIQDQVHLQGVLEKQKDNRRPLPGGGVVPVHADVPVPEGLCEVRLGAEIKSLPVLQSELRIGLSTAAAWIECAEAVAKTQHGESNITR